jgi:hypothetical protein
MLPENVSTNDTCPLVTWSLIDQPSTLRFRGDKQRRRDETRLRLTSRNDHLKYSERSEYSLFAFPPINVHRSNRQRREAA